MTRPGGIICITESNIVESNSPALTKLCNIVLETCFRSGRFFEQRSDGIISKLVLLMEQHSIREVQTRKHTLIFKAGTSEHQSLVEDMTHLFRVSLPFFQKWTPVPSDYQDIYQQALKEMQQPDFEAMWQCLTAWGTTPMSGGRMHMRGLS